jgi:cytochrome b561
MQHPCGSFGGAAAVDPPDFQGFVCANRRCADIDASGSQLRPFRQGSSDLAPRRIVGIGYTAGGPETMNDVLSASNQDRAARPRAEPRSVETALRRYSLTAIWLHWLIAGLIVANTAIALSADYWPDDWVRPVIDTHKSVGITVLGLALMRILWRATHPPPPLPPGYRRWERVASHGVHALLYLLILALPLTGWMHDSAWKEGPTHPVRLFWLVPWPRIALIADLEPGLKERMHDLLFSIHVACACALYPLLALHIAGALKHEFMDRERELARMWPSRQRLGGMARDDDA